MSISHSAVILNGKQYRVGETKPELYIRGQMLRVKAGGEYLVPVKAPDVKRGKVKGMTPQSAKRLRAKCECYRLKGNPPTVYLGATFTLGWVQTEDNLPRIQNAYAEMSHTFFVWFHRHFPESVLIYRNEQQVGRKNHEGKPHFHCLIYTPSPTVCPDDSLEEVQSGFSISMRSKWLELQAIYAGKYGFEHHSRAAEKIGVVFNPPPQNKTDAIARYLSKHAAKNGDQNTYPGRAWGIVNETLLEPVPALNLIPSFCKDNPAIISRAMVYMRREARKLQRYSLTLRYFKKCIKSIDAEGVQFIQDYTTPRLKRLWKRYTNCVNSFKDNTPLPQYFREYVLQHYGEPSRIHCLMPKMPDYGTLHPMPLRAAMSKGFTLDGISTATQTRLVLEAFKRALRDF